MAFNLVTFGWQNGFGLATVMKKVGKGLKFILTLEK
jgi:hypothetical protein